MPPFIPPQIWAMAVALGHLRAAWIDTHNLILPPAIYKIELNLKQYCQERRAKPE